MEGISNEVTGIEYILKDIGGAFGKYQIYNYLMLSYFMFVTGTFVLDYVFVTLKIDHRCKIDGCDKLNVGNYMFEPDWLQHSTPYINGEPDSCHRYERSHSAQSEYICDIDVFNRTSIVYCGNGSMIFRTDEVSIVNQFDLTCEENVWKIAMVGTWSNIGRLIFLPVVGYLSDWLGRKGVLVTTTVLSSILKIAKSFAVGYNSFVIIEMIDSGFASAIYPTALILAMELVPTEDSNLVSCLILAIYPLGQVATALIASYVHHYQWLLRMLAVFGLATFPCFWLLPESFRWLLVNQKYTKSVETVEHAADTNGITVSAKTYDIIAMTCKKEHEHAEVTMEKRSTLLDVFKSFTLTTRFILCTFCWISSTFITYGVSILSVSMPGDKYVNFMVVSFAGMPGTLFTFLMLKYMSRRWSMSISFFITGICILASKYLDSNATLALIFFFLAKLFINHSFTYLYVYTNEMWPTILRNQVMGFCSMIARIGSICAPLSPILATVHPMLPFYLFSGFACLSAILILFLPETFKQEKLPDSIADIKKRKK